MAQGLRCTGIGHRLAGVVLLAGLAVLASALGAILGARPARAQIGSDRYSSIIIDASTGNILSAVNADDLRYPASLTKLMTLFATFEALRDHRIALTDLVPVSARAAATPPTKLGLTPATRITVEQAILGLVTKSANDAAAALGEMLGGDEDRFAAMMTLRARALGMTHSVFRNASGLPDVEQVSTARDLALLARHLVTDFAPYYGYFSAPGFIWHGRMIPNHDHLLDTYPGADGMKTGYTVLAGHNLVTSAQRSGVRLIGVVLGAASNGERDIHMAALLDQGFERMNVAPVGPAGRRGWMEARQPSVFASAQAATLPAAVAAPTASASAGAAGSGAMGSSALGSGAMGSGAMGSGAPGSGAMGSGAMGSGAMGSGAVAALVPTARAAISHIALGRMRLAGSFPVATRGRARTAAAHFTATPRGAARPRRSAASRLAVAPPAPVAGASRTASHAVHRRACGGGRCVGRWAA